MNKKILAFTLFTTLCLSLTACSQNAAGNGKADTPTKNPSTSYAEAPTTEAPAAKTPNADTEKANEKATDTLEGKDADNAKAADSGNAKGTDAGSTEDGAERTITDLGGNVVKIPAASLIKRIAILAPPVMSFAVETVPDTKMIVAISPIAFTNANTDIVAKVFPNWKSVNTSFLNGNFAVNTESLLKLQPDVILYYGTMQKQGLSNIGIPCVDFYSKEQLDPQAQSIAWENQIRKIFDLETTNTQQKEWNRTEELAAKLLVKRGEQKSGLCVFSDTAGKIMVSGKNSFDAYAQSYFDMAGIRNVAADLEGTVEVSMEKIYQWNPDMIIVFQNAPAKDILANSVQGQDWSLLNAWKNKAVYDVPRTTFSWITPCADSSLLPLWLISKAYPELMSDDEMRTEISDYYSRNYGISLTDGDLHSILDYRKAAGS